jgi:hypothetical protein
MKKMRAMVLRANGAPLVMEERARPAPGEILLSDACSDGWLSSSTIDEAGSAPVADSRRSLLSAR